MLTAAATASIRPTPRTPAIGLIGGMAAGGGIGAAVGHIKGGMKDSGLKQVAGTLMRGHAGLIVVYAANMSEQINAAIKAENKYVSKELNVGQAVLDKQIATDASG
jgi:uncharacterized membrane protein